MHLAGLHPTGRHLHVGKNFLFHRLRHYLLRWKRSTGWGVQRTLATS